MRSARCPTRAKRPHTHLSLSLSLCMCVCFIIICTRRDSHRRTLTFLIISLFWSSRNLTRTCVTWPLAPVRPITFITIASLIGASCIHTHPPTHTHTHIHTYIHTYIYIHIHTSVLLTPLHSHIHTLYVIICITAVRTISPVSPLLSCDRWRPDWPRRTRK